MMPTRRVSGTVTIPRITVGTVLEYLILSIAALLLLFPLLYSVIISFCTAAESVSYPPTIIPSTFNFGSYIKAMETAPVLRFIFNSFVVSLVVTLGQLITASLAAYAFSFLQFPGRSLFFAVFMSTMMIPWEVTIIPNYFTVKELGWLDSYQGLTIPFLATAFGTFLLRQSFLTIPRELSEAARIDGCGHLRFFLTMVLPLSRPALGTLAVYAFLNTYNLYLWPLLITNTDTMRTVQIGLAMLQWEQAISWNTMMAGVILVSLPTLILLILGQKQLIRGLTAGALKG